MSTLGNIELNISEDAVKYAKIISLSIHEEEKKRRAFLSIAALDTFADYLVSQDINVSISKNLFKIAPINAEFEMADIYYNGWKLDVRVVGDDNILTVPQVHFKSGITPDFYVAVKVDEKLEKVVVLGYVDSADINKKSKKVDYYVVDFAAFLPNEDLINKLKTQNDISLELKDHDDFEGHYLAYLDDEINAKDKKRLIKHLVNCKQCREAFVEFFDFETIVSNSEKYPEIFEDQTLGVVGAVEANDVKYDGQEVVINLSQNDDEILDGLFANSISKNTAIVEPEEVEEPMSFSSNEEEEANEDEADIEELAEELLEDNLGEEPEEESTEEEFDFIIEDVDDSEDDILSEFSEELTLVDEDTQADEAEIAITDESVQVDSVISDEDDLIFDAKDDDGLETLDFGVDESLEESDELSLESNVSDVLVDADDFSLEAAEDEVPAESDDFILESADTDELVESEEFDLESNDSDDFELEELEEVSDEEENILELEEAVEEEPLLEKSSDEIPEIEGLDIDLISDESVENQEESPEVELASDNMELSFDDIPEVTLEDTGEETQEAGEDFLNVDEVETAEAAEEDNNLDEVIVADVDFLDDADSLSVDEDTSDAQVEEPILENIVLEEEADSEESINIEDTSEANIELEDNDAEEITLEDIDSLAPEQNDELVVQEPEDSSLELNQDDYSFLESDDYSETDAANDVQMEEISDQDLDGILSGESDDNSFYEDAFGESDDERPSGEFEDFMSKSDAEENTLVFEDSESLGDDSASSSEPGPGLSSLNLEELVLENEQPEETVIPSAFKDIERPSSFGKKKKLTVLMSAIVGCLLLATILGASLLIGGNSKKSKEVNPELVSQLGDRADLFNLTNEDSKGNEAILKKPLAKTPKDMNKVMTNVFSETPSSVTVTKIAWEVPQSLAVNDMFKEFLQVSGKNLQVNLKSDLIDATEFAYNDKIKVDIIVKPDGKIKDIKVLGSSGSSQIDTLVVKSIKETMDYINIPTVEQSKANVKNKLYNLKLVINF